MRGAGSVFAALCGWAAVMVLGACQFSPAVSSGTLACDRGRCPPGHFCSPSGFCCREGDGQKLCARTEPGVDGGGGRPAAVDASVAADADPAPVDADLVDAKLVDADVSQERGSRLVPGSVRLVRGAYSCTAARSSAGNDRWCAFYRDRELWVLNATRAAQQGSVRCDGSDPGCLRLTENVFRADLSDNVSYADLAASAFTGELLIYYADGRQAADEIFRGGVYAWRPGWTLGRRLTSASGEYCSASDLDSASVLCTDNREGLLVDLIGGRLPSDGSALPRIERVNQQPPTSALITSSGDYILYSYSSATNPKPDLYLVAAGQVAEPGSRVLLVSDAQLAAVGGNGSKAYFYRSVDPTTQAGTLFRVDLPTGRNIIEIARGVQYAMHPFTSGGREQGLVTIENLDERSFGDPRLFWDPAMPTSSLTPGRTWAYGLQFSPEGRFVSTLAPQEGPLLQSRVFDTTTGKSCQLGDTRKVPPALERFSSDGRLVFWEKYTSETGIMEAWVSSSADCTPVRQLGSRVTLMYLLADGGVVFREGGGGAGQLRFLPSGEMFTAAAPQDVAAGADPGFAIISGDPSSLVVFTSSVSGKEGLYIAKVPF